MVDRVIVLCTEARLLFEMSLHVKLEGMFFKVLLLDY